ncbi:MAG: hypothetical protein ACOX1S_05490 [Anaerostipes sp.]|jgi:hypothetical protein|nr:hypothetical protein [Anaerostipes sp.]
MNNKKMFIEIEINQNELLMAANEMIEAANDLGEKAWRLKNILKANEKVPDESDT